MRIVLVVIFFWKLGYFYADLRVMENEPELSFSYYWLLDGLP